MGKHDNSCVNKPSADSIGRRLQSDFRDFLNQAAESFRGYGFLSDLESELRELEKTIVRPFNIALFGRVKTGKSSIVNALIGRPLAITGCEETTATVNVISHVEANSELKDKFTVHWKDRPPETFPLSQLASEWSGKSKEVLEDNVRRTKYIQLYSDDESLGLHEIIDTPGTDSVVAAHEKIAQDFINPSVHEGRKADALVYVFGMTAHESDEKSLQRFRDGCLAGSGPYNSVGVVHKWDGLYWDNGGKMDEIVSKCERLHSQLTSLVADVIPISAPIALLSESASDDYLTQLVNVASRVDIESLVRLLSDADDWDEDEERHRLRRDMKEIPWACFRVALRECARQQCKTSADCREVLWKLSGFDQFRKMLDQRFFRRGALIRQRQIYSRIDAIRNSAYERIDLECERRQDDLEKWGSLSVVRIDDDGLRCWVKEKKIETRRTCEDLRDKWIKLDEVFIRSEIPKLINDVAALEWCRSCGYEEITEKIDDTIAPILDFFSGSAVTLPSDGDLVAMLDNLCLLQAAGIESSGLKWSEHLRNRIESLIERNQNA